MFTRHNQTTASRGNQRIHKMDAIHKAWQALLTSNATAFEAPIFLHDVRRRWLQVIPVDANEDDGVYLCWFDGGDFHSLTRCVGRHIGGSISSGATRLSLMPIVRSSQS